MRTIEKKFKDALAAIPAPGCGCHASLLGTANLGIMAGLDDNAILAEIRSAIPAGKRRVADREIMDAIQRAHKDTVPLAANAPRQRPVPPPRRSPAERLAAILKDSPEAAEKLKAKIIDAGGRELDLFSADVWEQSPIRIQAAARLEKYPFSEDGVQLLTGLYDPADILFIGTGRECGQEQRDHIKTAEQWIAFFQDRFSQIAAMPETAQETALKHLGDIYPLIIPNPLSGREESTKDGEKTTMRGDACVKTFRFAVLESDSVPFPQQGALLRGLCRMLDCKICAVIFSGGKSFHAWVKLSGIATLADWEREIKNKFFQILGKIGFDGACCNAARLSRFPGMFRADKAQFQKLLFLAPEGSAV